MSIICNMIDRRIKYQTLEIRQ